MSDEVISAPAQVASLKRRLLLDSAVELFYRHGYHGTTMAMIASSLGVSRKFLYRLYVGKADILSEIFAEAEAIALDVLDRELSSTGAPHERLCCVLRHYAESIIGSPHLVAVFLAEDRNLPDEKRALVQALIKRWDDGVEQLLREGRDAGVFAFEDAGLILQMIKGMIVSSYDWAEKGSWRREQVVNALLRGAMALAGSAQVNCLPNLDTCSER